MPRLIFFHQPSDPQAWPGLRNRYHRGGRSRRPILGPVLRPAPGLKSDLRGARHTGYLIEVFFCALCANAAITSTATAMNEPINDTAAAGRTLLFLKHVPEERTPLRGHVRVSGVPLSEEHIMNECISTLTFSESMISPRLDLALRAEAMDSDLTALLNRLDCGAIACSRTAGSSLQIPAPATSSATA